VPVWVVPFLLALDGWLGFECWRGLARGEISDFRRFGSVLIRRSDHAVWFWTTWTIKTGGLLALSVFIAILLFGGGVKL
jgi:hypothetical protein